MSLSYGGQSARGNWRFVAVGLTAVMLAGVPATASAASDPINCGTVVAEANNDITSFNPLYANDLGDSRAAQLLFQPLVWVGRHGYVENARGLASNIAVSPDTTSYVITLRAWRWSDGVPVTAEDVIYEWRMIERLGVNYPGYGSGGIPSQVKSITALDSTHVRFLLTHPVNPLWFIENGLSQITPLPSHAWSAFSLSYLYEMQSEPGFFRIVDGPMRLQRLDVGMDAVFVPDPLYAGPKPHLQRLVLIFEHGDGAALQQVEAGDLDFAPLPMELYGAVRHMKGVHLELLSPVSFWYFLNLNFHNPQVAFFCEVRVRQAIQDALDQKAIIQLVFHGFGNEVYTAIPPVDANLLAPDLSRGAYPVGHSLKKARELLAAAGFTPGSQGILQRHGRRLEFTVLIGGDSGEATEMLVMIQAQLRDIGIDMKLHEIDFSQMMNAMQNQPLNWEAAELGTYLNPYPTGEGMFATGAGQNNGGYSDSVMDKLINASINKPGLGGLYAYEDYIAAQQPVIFLPTEKHLDLVSDSLHGVGGFGDGELLAPDALYCTKTDKPAG